MDSDKSTDGQEMYDLIKLLYPICRSITGNGVRQTLKIIQEKIPIEIKEIPSGTKVFDWTIPKEWNIKDAYVKDSSGNKIIDFKDSNLVLACKTIIRQFIPRKFSSSVLNYLKHDYYWIHRKMLTYRFAWASKRNRHKRYLL